MTNHDKLPTWQQNTTPAEIENNSTSLSFSTRDAILAAMRDRWHLTVSAWITWLETQNTTPQTRTTYENGLVHFISWYFEQWEKSAVMPPSDITNAAASLFGIVSVDVVENYKRYLSENFAPTGVNIKLVPLRRFFSYIELKDKTRTFRNPAENVRGERIRRGFHKRDGLTVKEAKQLLDAIPNHTPEGIRDYAMIKAILNMGLRQIEISRALVEDWAVRGGYTVLYIQGKGSREKDDYMIANPDLTVAINQWLQVHPLRAHSEFNRSGLFCSFSRRSLGSPLSTSYVRRLVKKYLREIGIDDKRLTTHSLRKTAITEVGRETGDDRKTQRFARHLSLDTTAIYRAEIDRMDDPAELKISL